MQLPDEIRVTGPHFVARSIEERSTGLAARVVISESREEKMSKKLFVGSLSWNTNDDELRRAFEGFGEVTDAKVISDRETGRSRGFGFVTFAEADSANSAIEQMNGSMLDGRTINVNEAQERGPRGGGGRGRGGGGRW